MDPHLGTRVLTNARHESGTGTLSAQARQFPPLNLRVKIFADGADKASMLEMYADPRIAGFTTNPTLMRKSGVADYVAFAEDILQLIPDRPVSFEVFADEFDEMEQQALEIASWSANAIVKVPVTNTRGQATDEVLDRLRRAGVRMNVTALLTLQQVSRVASILGGGPPGIISVFAGRIADTGRDPVPLMAAAVELLRPYPNLELIWASPRELLNVLQADAIGCHIITATTDILRKLQLVGKNLDDYSLETVKMFHDDAKKAGYRIETGTGKNKKEDTEFVA
jgi:transaldolase